MPLHPEEQRPTDRNHTLKALGTKKRAPESPEPFFRIGGMAYSAAALIEEPPAKSPVEAKK